MAGVWLPALVLPYLNSSGPTTSCSGTFTALLQQLLSHPCSAPPMMRCVCCLLPATATVDNVMNLATTMQEKGVSQKCQDEAVENLASCATDDSMAVKQGCCSKDCSSGIKKVGGALLGYRGAWPFGLTALGLHPSQS